MELYSESAVIIIFIIVCRYCNYVKCHYNASYIESYIIGGAPTVIKQFPHAVYLSMVYQHWICGGSVLNQWAVMTAAHCVADINSDEYKIDVYAGHENIMEVTIIRPVNKYKLHEHYNTEHKQFDIALVFLENELPLGDFIKRVTIRRYFPFNVRVAQVSGWGVTNEKDASHALVLRFTKQKLVGVDKCASFKHWRQGLLCAGDSHKNRPALGDSGSALITSEYQQIGIVAFRVSYAPKMTFYTNVTHYYDWITTTIRVECAEDGNKMEGFIIGGNYSTIERFPHSVAMFVHPTETFYCGGSVLNQEIVLTAAHCTPSPKKQAKYTVYIMAGHENLEQVKIYRVVDKFNRHPNYSSVAVSNDIALLFLKEDLPLGITFNIKRVIITDYFPFNQTIGEVAGWGHINDTTKENSLILKYTTQNIIPLEECKKDNDLWLPGMMCAGDPESDTNRPSKGDSGGALVVSGYHQIGLVSFRNLSVPGLIYYTNISYYYDWIVSQTMYTICGNFKQIIIRIKINAK